MQPARGGGIADGFGDVHRERDHVMLHARFNFMNARGVNFRAFANNFRRVLRNLSGFGQRFRGGNFNVQPLLKAIRIAPDAAHFFSSVTMDQDALLDGRLDFRSTSLITTFKCVGRFPAL